LVGRADAVLVERLDAVSASQVPPQAQILPSGRTAPVDLSTSTEGEVSFVVPDAGVLATASFGADPAR
jgi:hypothetical protein